MRRCQLHENHNICRVCIRGCWIKPPCIYGVFEHSKLLKKPTRRLLPSDAARGGEIRTVFLEAFGKHGLLLRGWHIDINGGLPCIFIYDAIEALFTDNRARFLHKIAPKPRDLEEAINKTLSHVVL